jgi:hypothetical protein
MTDADQVPAGVDASTPTAARIYDYWLGGRNNFAADRAAAQQVAEFWPDAPLAARENRRFLRRAVRFLAGEAGIGQFLDLGTGLPATGSVHEVAQAVVPDARVIYVDSDPMVLAHAKALKTSDTVAVLHADLCDVSTIMEHPDTRRLIDFSQPLAVLFVAVLHFIHGPDAGQAVTGYLGHAAAGSYLVLSHGASDEKIDAEGAEKGRAAYASTANPVTGRPRSEIFGFFDGLEILEPGLVPVAHWRPGNSSPADEDMPPLMRAMLGAVGRKPY